MHAFESQKQNLELNLKVEWFTAGGKVYNRFKCNGFLEEFLK